MTDRVVCDASAGFDFLLVGPGGGRVAAALDGATVHVPALFALEVSAAARGQVLRGRIGERRALTIVEDVARFPAVVWGHERSLLLRAWELRDNVSTYDAIYVALSERLEATLVTADRRLADAARRFAECEIVDTAS